MNSGRLETETEPLEGSCKETVINQQGAKLRIEQGRFKETWREMLRKICRKKRAGTEER